MDLVLEAVYRVIAPTAPIWLPIGLFASFFMIRMNYLRRKWIKERGSIVLEIRLPKDTTKSPAAIEWIISGLFEPIVGTVLDAMFKGRVRDWFSLELVSIDGQVKFFIWCQTPWKKIIETRVYAQYPGAEVIEVPDYTLGVHFDPNKIKLWACQMGKNKEDIYPMKTYVDFGLDFDNREERDKLDPLTPVIEFLGSMNRGESAWIQILIQANQKMGFSNFVWNRGNDLTTRVKKEVERIIKEEPYAQAKEVVNAPAYSKLSETQKEVIKAIERNAYKMNFDTGIRVITWGDPAVYQSTNGGGIITSMRLFGTYSNHYLNGLRPKWFAGLDDPWTDFRNTRQNKNKRMVLDAYKRRSLFHQPYKNWNMKPFLMSAEELATIWHFPSYEIASTPTLNRIPSKKAEAPANLPI